jgi:hypothetical protein
VRDLHRTSARPTEPHLKNLEQAAATFVQWWNKQAPGATRSASAFA